MLKYLRIAVTALSLTACVLLIALWVRSYWWWDSLGHKLHPKCTVAVNSCWGRVEFSHYHSVNGEWTNFASRLDNGPPSFSHTIPPTGFGAVSHALGTSVFVPHWLLVLVSAALAAVPWLTWSRRFSVRALLIATTLVAVALAAIIYAAR